MTRSASPVDEARRVASEVQRTTVQLGRVLLDEFVGAPGGTMHAHEQDDTHVCLLCAGSLEESRRDGSTVRSAGSARISPAGDAHDVRFGGDGTHCIMVRFASESPFDFPSPKPARVTTARIPLFAPIARDLEDQLRTPSSVSVLVVAERALELFAILCRAARARRTSPPPAWLDRVRDRIRDTPERPPALEDLAAIAGSHPAHVLRAFKHRFGCTPGEYARRTRLTHAARLLDSPSLTLAAVAATAGFCDQSHMNREFRRLANTTPLALRSAWSRRRQNAHRIQDTPATLV